MKNWKTEISIISVLAILVFIVIVLLPNGGKEGNYPLTGRYIEASSGQHMIYRNTDTGGMRYVFMIPNGEATMFDDFETGDAIRVQSEPRIQKTDDGVYYSHVYDPERIRDTPQIPELTEEVLSYVESLAAMFTTNYES